MNDIIIAIGSILFVVAVILFVKKRNPKKPSTGNSGGGINPPSKGNNPIEQDHIS